LEIKKRKIDSEWISALWRGWESEAKRHDCVVGV